MRPIIKVENLSKRYRIGARQAAAYSTVREALAGAVKAPLNRLRRSNGHKAQETKWALRDVGFEVAPGEVIGIIGRNGAGKSTLLKILSRITEPTTGRVELYGRVGSLLEVGTGFHPELTGRENVYLNGSIIGMSRREIERKFDEIVAFAEVEQYIDTPVKRYSSGMQVRLAFAVAAHLEPEILVVDEVLAVGDAAFQRKCLGKMGDVAKQGRTVLFVSHDLAAVRQLCERVMLLAGGQLVMNGEPAHVIDTYIAESYGESISWEVDAERLKGEGPVRITGIELLDLEHRPLKNMLAGNGLILRVRYELEKGVRIPSASFVVRFKTQMGTEVLRLSNAPISGFPITNLEGSGQVELVLPVVPFTGGNYFLDVAFGRRMQGYYANLTNILSLSIANHDVYESGSALDQSRCLLTVVHRWLHEPEKGQRVDSGWIGRGLLELPRGDFDEED
ncbi:MAG TPA: ABC transporter ATP-binding protein [Pyrinomonadaceae bacterium]|jgi:lipopolysaccharide transport system ATP-binding protein